MDSELLQKATLFVSDIHLGGFSEPNNREIENDFLLLMEIAEQFDMRIVILGDLLDYYMQYNTYVPEAGRKVFDFFKDYHSRRKSSSIFVTGNHDNWDDGFLRSIGFEVGHEYLEMQLGNRNVLLLHGDGLDDQSMGLPREFFHRLLRNRYFVKVFKSLTTPSFGNRIMRFFSMGLRNLKGERSSKPEYLQNWAFGLMKRTEWDTVICGHNHCGAFLSEESGMYLNAGAFFADRTCILHTTEGFHFVRWDSINRSFHIIIAEVAESTE